MVDNVRQLRRIEKKEKKARNILKDVKYRRSAGGRIGSGVSKFFSVARKGISRSLYDKQNTTLQRLRGSTKVKKRVKRGRGRPKGTVKYRDPRTGQPIGVYEYRKILSARLKRERLQALQRSVVNPKQQAILDRINQKEAMRRMSPERKVIPDTYGQLPLNSIFKEIEDASNIFP